jgi:hypothetical protein
VQEDVQAADVPVVQESCPTASANDARVGRNNTNDDDDVQAVSPADGPIQERCPTVNANDARVESDDNDDDDVQAVSTDEATDGDDDDDDDDDDADPVKGPHATWTPEEDAKLTTAITKTTKKKYGKEFRTDWAAISALVPGRTNRQCMHRWQGFLDPSIGRASGLRVKWTEDEDSKLKHAVRTYAGNNWGAIAALIPGRTKESCRTRWHQALDPSIGRENGRSGAWAEDEDNMLKHAVRTHGGKNWPAISALVPGRTNSQCHYRWQVLGRSPKRE